MKIGSSVLRKKPKNYVEIGKSVKTEKELDLKLLKLRRSTEKHYIVKPKSKKNRRLTA